MQAMLRDDDTYEKRQKCYTEKQSKAFNKEARKILKQSEKGKKMHHLLEEAPSAPKMRGVPKMHKKDIPMRPITSGIGSAPHNMAKILAKPLTKALGTVSDAHIKNTAEMMSKLKEVTNVKDLKVASFDVKALFTNVPVEGALSAIENVVDAMDDDDLPLPKADYIKMVKLCMNFGCFSFNGEEYVQKSGLAMGSPLSPVAACLYMETLEESNFFEIMGRDTIWMRYIDDVLAVVPKDTDLDKKLVQLNEVNEEYSLRLRTNEMAK